jgi:hypothetical protein
MTTIYNEELGFKNISLINFHTISVTGEVGRYGPVSFTAGFNPGAFPSNFNFNPNTASTTDVRNAVATLYALLFKPR